MSKRQQASKPTRTVYAILSPEGFTVHTCKSRSDAYRIAAKYDRADASGHEVRPLARSNAREV